jgi:hypothetical protein
MGSLKTTVGRPQKAGSLPRHLRIPAGGIERWRPSPNESKMRAFSGPLKLNDRPISAAPMESVEVVLCIAY